MIGEPETGPLEIEAQELPAPPRAAVRVVRLTCVRAGNPGGVLAAALRRATGLAPGQAAAPGAFRHLALLDAARDRRIGGLLQRASERHASLLGDGPGLRLSTHGPHLVELPPGATLTATLQDEGWGQSWGVHLTSSEPFEQLVQSLQRLLLVQDEQGRRLFFRFYDPRVLRVFLPIATPPQARLFFDAVGTFVIEDSDPGAALMMTRIV